MTKGMEIWQKKNILSYMGIDMKKIEHTFLHGQDTHGDWYKKIKHTFIQNSTNYSISLIWLQNYILQRQDLSIQKITIDIQSLKQHNTHDILAICTTFFGWRMHTLLINFFVCPHSNFFRWQLSTWHHFIGSKVWVIQKQYLLDCYVVTQKKSRSCQFPR